MTGLPADFVPAEAFHPGEFAQQELDAREWSRAYAADRADVPIMEFIEFLEGRKSVDSELALRLGRLFGTSDSMWRVMQIYYDRWRAAQP